MTIPIDITKSSLSPPPVPPPPIPTNPPEVLRSSLKKSSSTHNNLDQIPLNRTYGLKINPNEQVIHYLNPYTKHSIPDLPSMTTINRPSTAHSFERTVNEVKISTPDSYSAEIINQQQKKVTIQLSGKQPQPKISK